LSGPSFIAVNKITEVYLLKKEQLTKFCEQQKIKTSGKVSDLRARVVRFLRGELITDDFDEGINKEEVDQVYKISVSNKINLKEIEQELGLNELECSSEESINNSRIKTDIFSLGGNIDNIIKRVDVCLNISDNFLEQNSDKNSIINTQNKIKITPEKELTQFSLHKQNPIIEWANNLNNTSLIKILHAKNLTTTGSLELLKDRLIRSLTGEIMDEDLDHKTLINTTKYKKKRPFAHQHNFRVNSMKT
jgi:hypothetical protein